MNKNNVLKSNTVFYIKKKNLTVPKILQLSEHLLEQLTTMITNITDILARKYLVRFIFLENDKNRKRIICPTGLDRKFADH